ncbi:MAG: hypothetical protein NT007_07270 [Candidatus Kapabacteria bacterium]|nr:hypothetical protein [Candidatus Kapabacteria bacterium]
MPKSIPIEEIKDGMILSDSLVNNFGQTLVPAGTVLSDRHSRILKTWNIFTVSIKSDSTEDDFEINDDIRKKAKEKLDLRMNWEPRNAAEEDLYLLGLLYTAKNLLK